MRMAVLLFISLMKAFVCVFVPLCCVRLGTLFYVATCDMWPMARVHMVVPEIVGDVPAPFDPDEGSKAMQKVEEVPQQREIEEMACTRADVSAMSGICVKCIGWVDDSYSSIPLMDDVDAAVDVQGVAQNFFDDLDVDLQCDLGGSAEEEDEVVFDDDVYIPSTRDVQAPVFVSAYVRVGDHTHYEQDWRVCDTTGDGSGGLPASHCRFALGEVRKIHDGVFDSDCEFEDFIETQKNACKSGVIDGIFVDAHEFPMTGETNRYVEHVMAASATGTYTHTDTYVRNY